jgi:hypothetical protein
VADPTRIKRTLADMKAERQRHEQVWKDCYDWSYPERGSGFMTTVTDANDAQRRKANILDSTAGDSVQVGAATMVDGTVPANARWFGIDVGTESDEESTWLDGSSQFIWENIHNSNFDAEVFDQTTDEFVAGWAVLYCEEGPGGGYHFENWPLGQCYIASRKVGGKVDTVYREVEMNVSQVVATYGIDNVSDKVRQDFTAGKLATKVMVVHAIEPREMYVVGGKLAKNLPVASCHMEVDTSHVLREGGYHEFPCMVPRWMRLPNSAYATGPMSRALPDVKTLNEVVKWDLMGAETTLAPPLIAEDDGVLNTKNIKIGARKVIVANSVDSIKPLITGANVQYGALKIEQLQAAVRKVLMADQLPPADGPVKTAYEWSVRVQTLRKILGPMFGRRQAEFLQPLVERTFGIAWRANEASGYALMGRPPESLRGRNFTVRYLSPLAKAQQLEDVASMDRFEGDLLATAQGTQDPSVLDVYDMEEGKRTKAKLLGVPQKLVRDEKTVAKVRQMRQQAQAAAQEQQAQQQVGMEAGAAMAKRMATGT